MHRRSPVLTRFEPVFFACALSSAGGLAAGCLNGSAWLGGNGDAGAARDAATATADGAPTGDATADGGAIPEQAIRIQAECAHGPDVGDCAFAFAGGFAGTVLENADTTIGYFDAGDHLAYHGVELTGADQVVLRYAKGNAGGTVALRLDAVDGALLATFAPASTGGWTTWQEIALPITPTGGIHDLYLVGAAAEGVTNLDWLELGACAPRCDGLECGPDGCGGSCGTCPDGLSCRAGACGAGGAILAIDAAAEMANGFNVGNTFDVPQHPRDPSSVNAMIDAYYAEGFRTVRIPVRWIGSDWGEGDLAGADGVVDRGHPRLAALEAAVDHALAKEMYVVINTHHEDWLFDRPFTAAQADVFDRLWSDICDIFRERPHGLIFEIINEPHGAINGDAAAVRTLNRRAYDRIRGCGGNNPERIVIIDGQDWGSPASLAATWPQVTDIPGGGDDPYLMGSIHYYNPLALTHAGDAGGIDTAWAAGDIDATFAGVAGWADGRLPVFVGEFGVNWDQHAHVINDNVRGWYAAVAAEARERGWGFTVWDDGGWFRVMDRTTQAFDGLQDACVP